MPTDRDEAPEELGQETDVVAEQTRQLPAVRASEAMIARHELTVDEIVGQKDKIVQIMERVMKRDVHYGVIPGVGKPSLYKPGAEAINVALRLAPHYDSEKIWHEDGHLTVVAKCELQHIPTRLVVGTGEGLCTSLETRYAYRTAKRRCPLCGEEQIRRSKKSPREGDYEGASPNDPPGWYCWKKEGGCGANFANGDARIVDQEEGKIANPDIPDTWNTVLKMADKRSLVAAVLNATAASDVFTQDVEDGGAESSGAPEDSELGRTYLKHSAHAEPNEPVFDPARHLLPNAIRGDDAAEQLREAQRLLASDLDWPAMVGEASLAALGPREQWGEEQTREFWHRWANMVARLQTLAEESPDWHPELGIAGGEEGDALIVQAFEFAFEMTPSLPLPKLSQSSDIGGDHLDSADEVPFGEDDVVDGEAHEVEP